VPSVLLVRVDFTAGTPPLGDLNLAEVGPGGARSGAAAADQPSSGVLACPATASVFVAGFETAWRKRRT
jgi:hypothetical protein